MSTKKVYQDEVDKEYASGVSKYVHGVTVREGELLHVTHISGTFDNIATTEYIEMGYYNGHAYIPVFKDNPEVAGDKVHWNGDLWLRDNQFVYIYCADVASGEHMKLNASGKWE
jgi:hypothetical protein